VNAGLDNDVVYLGPGNDGGGLLEGAGHRVFRIRRPLTFLLIPAGYNRQGFAHRFSRLTRRYAGDTHDPRCASMSAEEQPRIS